MSDYDNSSPERNTRTPMSNNDSAAGGGRTPSHIDRRSKMSNISRDPRARSSLASINDRLTNNALQEEVSKDVEEMKELMVDDQWTNIAVPVRNTLIGLITFCERLASRFVLNDEKSRAFAQDTQNRLKVFIDKTGRDFELADQKTENSVKKVSDRLKKLSEKLSYDLNKINENMALVNDKTKKYDTTLDIWDGKIRKLDKKMQGVEEVSRTIKMNGQVLTDRLEAMVNEVKNELLVENVIGENPTDPYKNLSQFIAEVHEHKEEVMGATIHVAKTHCMEQVKILNKTMKEQQDDLIDSMRIQETQIQNLRDKIDALDEEVVQVQEDAGDSDAKSRARSRAASYRRRNSHRNLDKNNEEFESQNGDGFEAPQLSLGDNDQQLKSNLQMQMDRSKSLLTPKSRTSRQENGIDVPEGMVKTKSFLDGRNLSENRHQQATDDIQASKTPTDNKSGMKEVIIEEVANSGAENDSPSPYKKVKSDKSDKKEDKNQAKTSSKRQEQTTDKQTKTAEHFNKKDKSKKVAGERTPHNVSSPTGSVVIPEEILKRLSVQERRIDELIDDSQVADLKLDAKTKALRDIIFGLAKQIHQKDVQSYQINVKRQEAAKRNRDHLKQKDQTSGEQLSQPQKPDVQISITSRGNVLVPDDAQHQSPTAFKDETQEDRKTQMQQPPTNIGGQKAAKDLPELPSGAVESYSDVEFPILEPKYDFIQQYIRQNERDENLKILLSNQDIMSGNLGQKSHHKQSDRQKSQAQHQPNSSSSRNKNNSKMNSPSVVNPKIDVKRMGQSRRGTKDHQSKSSAIASQMSSQKHSDPTKSSGISSAVNQSMQNRLRQKKRSLEQKASENERTVVARRGTQENKTSGLNTNFKPTSQAQKQQTIDPQNNLNETGRDMERNQNTVTTDGTLKNPQTANQSSIQNQNRRVPIIGELQQSSGENNVVKSDDKQNNLLRPDSIYSRRSSRSANSQNQQSASPSHNSRSSHSSSHSQRSHSRQSKRRRIQLMPLQQEQYHQTHHNDNESQSGRSMLSGASARHMCSRCKGESFKRPCLDYVDELRDEFRTLIEKLFHKRMREFIDFIEDKLEVEDQVDVTKENVIDTFYKKNNTVNKMNENFRLLEFKRKKYLERKQRQNASLSKSPVRSQKSQDVNKKMDSPEPNQNFQKKLHDLQADINANSARKKTLNQTESMGEGDLEDSMQMIKNPRFGTNHQHKLLSTSVDQNQKNFRTNVGQRVAVRANSSHQNMTVEQQKNTATERGTPTNHRSKALPSYRQNHFISGQVNTVKAGGIHQSNHAQNHHHHFHQNSIHANKNQNHNLINMSASDATTQRNMKYHTMVNSSEQVVQGAGHNNLVANQKLPIISTRKTHFAIDQRVWDANQVSNDAFGGVNTAGNINNNSGGVVNSQMKQFLNTQSDQRFADIKVDEFQFASLGPTPRNNNNGNHYDLRRTVNGSGGKGANNQVGSMVVGNGFLGPRLAAESKTRRNQAKQMSHTQHTTGGPIEVKFQTINPR